MEKFKTLTSTVVPLPVAHIDTDQIIPSRFLKATTRDGFGNHLFYDWRYDKEGKQVATFVLNDPTYTGTILVTGKNFGSGSSREHAVWAIGGYGFKVVVSSFFADIFKTNALNNGILPVVVSPQFLSEIFEAVKKEPEITLTVNLEKQIITNNATGKSQNYDINPFKKTCLLEGLDDIEYLLRNKERIVAYEKLSIFANHVVNL